MRQRSQRAAAIRPRSPDRPFRALAFVLSFLMACAVHESHAQDANSLATPQLDSPRPAPAASVFGAASVAPEFGAGSVRLAGNADTLRLEARHATVADVLAAMGRAFGLHYRSPVALDEPISGIYAGSLGRVLARVLAGYDYTIKHRDHAVDVSVLGKHGAVEVSAPEKHGEQAVMSVAPAASAPVRRGRCGRSAGHQAACLPI